MLLKITDGAKQFGSDELFDGVDLEIKGTEKVAIIGPNGCGKTTLLKILLGQEELDKGHLNVASNISLGYLSQTAFADDNLTVREAFDQMYADILKIKSEMDRLAKRLEAEYSEELLERYSALEQDFELHDGYSYNQQQIMLFTRFGFEQSDLDRPISTFSGQFARRSTRSDVTPGMGSSRAGEMSRRMSLSTAPSAAANSGAKSRVRLYRCGWKTAVSFLPGKMSRREEMAEASSAGWWA